MTKSRCGLRVRLAVLETQRVADVVLVETKRAADVALVEAKAAALVQAVNLAQREVAGHLLELNGAHARNTDIVNSRLSTEVFNTFKEDIAKWREGVNSAIVRVTFLGVLAALAVPIVLFVISYLNRSPS